MSSSQPRGRNVQYFPLSLAISLDPHLGNDEIIIGIVDALFKTRGHLSRSFMNYDTIRHLITRHVINYKTQLCMGGFGD